MLDFRNVAKKQKYYVVWAGKIPGIYLSWSECEAQILGFPGAKYKAFDTQSEAEQAYDQTFSHFLRPIPKEQATKGKAKAHIIADSICVDAACSGNPGAMEYRGVQTATGRQLFHQGPFARGTNNIGEFLAIVHGLAYLKKIDKPLLPIYTDSATAIAWVRHKKARTLLETTPENEVLFSLIQRAESWLHAHTYKNPILKWETSSWGEIPADFGRK